MPKFLRLASCGDRDAGSRTSDVNGKGAESEDAMLDPQQLGKSTIGGRIRALQSTVSRVRVELIKEINSVHFWAGTRFHILIAIPRTEPLNWRKMIPTFYCQACP